MRYYSPDLTGIGMPKAILVIDHFHLVKYMNDKLTTLRRQLAGKADEAEMKLLKDTKSHVRKNLKGRK